MNCLPPAAVLPVDPDTFGLTPEVASLSHFLIVTLCSWCPGGWEVSVPPDDNFTINKYKRYIITSGGNIKLFTVCKGLFTSTSIISLYVLFPKFEYKGRALH